MRDELEALLNEILPLAKFNVAGFGRAMRLEEYRDGYADSQAFVVGNLPSWFIHAEVEVDMVSEVSFNRLVEALRSALGPLIGPDKSQLFFLTPHILGQGMYPDPDIARFTKQVIRCAALSGSARTADLLLGWVDGEPVRYTEMMVLQGIYQEQDRLDFQPGVRLTRLSRDGSSLFEMIPEDLALKLRMGTHHDSGSPPLAGLPGATVLCIDASAGPVLYKPEDATSRLPDVNRNSSLDYPTHLVLQALSLALNSHISVLHRWLNLDAEITMLTGGYNQPYSAPPRFPPWRVESAVLTQYGLDQARDLSEKLGKQSGNEVQVAIHRWVKSKPLFDLVDDSIDVRVALEALFYAGGENTELSLRLALRGAWYLGNSSAERSEYFQTLRDVYKTCSEAVHTGTLKGDARKNQQLLGKAQDICRHALLKRLDEGGTPDWDALVLGRDLD